MARIAVVPGDGIGREVIDEGIRVLNALQPDLEFEWFDLGADKYLAEGVTMPEGLMDRWRDEFDCIYLGALGDPRVPRTFCLERGFSSTSTSTCGRSSCWTRGTAPSRTRVLTTWTSWCFAKTPKGCTPVSVANLSAVHPMKWPLRPR